MVQLQQSVDLLVREKAAGSLPVTAFSEDLFSFLPIKSTEDFEQLCKLIQDAGNRQQLVNCSESKSKLKFILVLY